VDDARPRRVSDLLREGFEGFSRSQKAIARYIIDHLEEVAYLSAEELGQKGNTSSSTVVRFAQSLGFTGYPELQKAARDEYRLGRPPARSSTRTSSASPSKKTSSPDRCAPTVSASKRPSTRTPWNVSTGR